MLSPLVCLKYLLYKANYFSYIIALPPSTFDSIGQPVLLPNKPYVIDISPTPITRTIKKNRLCQQPAISYFKGTDKKTVPNRTVPTGTERLRAKNALIKKVKALIEEREAQLRNIGRKPSKN